MNRKIAWLVTPLLLACVHVAVAQQPTKVPLIGWLSARTASVPGLELLRKELAQLGYVEGKNVAFDSRYAENAFDRLPMFADELARLRVDVLLTPSTIEAVAAKKATRTIPVVVVSAADPVGAGLIDNLARPGGNITGVTNISSVLAGKQLELLKETFPSSPALQSCGIHRHPAPSSNGKKAKCRHENWVCSFILWK